MTDSVFITFLQHDVCSEERVLFIKRQNGEWWLPGGKISEISSEPKDAAQHLVFKLFGHWDWYPFGIGSWRLSPEAGGDAVHLFGSYQSADAPLTLTDTAVAELASEVQWFDRHEIHRHLYHCNDMPWGQAKMAIYSIHELFDSEARANGELLRDDLGLHKGITWFRPS